jgi:hypothetical protein
VTPDLPSSPAGEVAPLVVPASLAEALVELGRAAAAKLVVRDDAEGFARVPAEQRAALTARADGLADHLAAVCEAWPALAADEPRLGELRGQELLLLGLALGPELDRAVARTVRRALGDEPLTVAGLVDLAGEDLASRLALAELLTAEAPLVARGLVELDDPRATARVAVAPWLVVQVRRAVVEPARAMAD